MFNSEELYQFISYSQIFKNKITLLVYCLTMDAFELACWICFIKIHGYISFLKKLYLIRTIYIKQYLFENNLSATNIDVITFRPTISVSRLLLLLECVNIAITIYDLTLIAPKWTGWLQFLVAQFYQHVFTQYWCLYFWSRNLAKRIAKCLVYVVYAINIHMYMLCFFVVCFGFNHTQQPLFSASLFHKTQIQASRYIYGVINVGFVKVTGSMRTSRPSVDQQRQRHTQ